MKVYSMVIVGVAIFTLSHAAFASVVNTSTILTPASKCQTLECVRNNIDNVDKQIIALIGDRLTYVKRAGELKKHTVSVHDQARENKILQTAGQQAENVGYSASIASAVFKTILAQSNIYEKQFHHYQK